MKHRVILCVYCYAALCVLRIYCYAALCVLCIYFMQHYVSCVSILCSTMCPVYLFYEALCALCIYCYAALCVLCIYSMKHRVVLCIYCHGALCGLVCIYCYEALCDPVIGYQPPPPSQGCHHQSQLASRPLSKKASVKILPIPLHRMFLIENTQI